MAESGMRQVRGAGDRLGWPSRERNAEQTPHRAAHTSECGIVVLRACASYNTSHADPYASEHPCRANVGYGSGNRAAAP